MKDQIACTMEYIQDEFGKEILLKDGRFQVMMEWEKPYMQACIDALQPFGDVLEIGFGCGYSATHIQQFKIKSHTIIEYHPVVAQKAREWAKKYPHVVIVEETWQNALPSLGVFDAVFFDDYPLESGEKLKGLEEAGKHSYEILQEGSQLIEDVGKTLPFLNELLYSDADVQELVEHVLQDKTVSVDHVSRFLNELHARKQISAQQLAQTRERLGIASSSPEPEMPQQFHFRGPNERLLTFLQQVLNGHMRKGSRFSCFLSSATSKYEDSKFVDAVICNPDLDYAEHKIDIAVPSNCDYYVDRQALVMTITKMG
jgi:protein-L-isoaspartate O-methyltransferase